MDAIAEYDAVVLGAGIVGASTAWHMAQAGMRVAVVDAEGPAAAASGASDGAVSVASKKPGPLARLATASLLYTRVLAQGGVLGDAYEARPSYIFATGTAEGAAIDALAVKLAGLGEAVRLVQSGDARLLPGVGPGIERLAVLEGEGHMPGYRAVRAYLGDRRIARHWPARVRRIEDQGAAARVELDHGWLRAGLVVAALGTATPALFPAMPVRPRAGQLFVTDRGPVAELPGSLTSAAYLMAKTAAPAVLPQPPVVIDPLATGQLLIGSTREDHGDPGRVDFATLHSLMTRAAQAWPALGMRRVIRAFAGVRAAVSDGLPIVGRVPGQGRVWLATGFEGDGICLSAVIGREVAQMAAGLSPDARLAADLAALTPARFAAMAEGAA